MQRWGTLWSCIIWIISFYEIIMHHESHLNLRESPPTNISVIFIIHFIEIRFIEGT